MSLQQDVMEAMKVAMKEKNQEALAALRAVKSEILLAQTETGSKEEISEDQEMKRKFLGQFIGELFCSSRLEQTGSTFEPARMSNFLIRRRILGKLICSSRLEQTAQTFESTRMSSSRRFWAKLLCSSRLEQTVGTFESARMLNRRFFIKLYGRPNGVPKRSKP